MVMHKPDRVITTLYMSTFVTVLLVVLTRVGFPYSAKPGNLAPHRSFFLHTARQFYDRNGLLLDEDSGYFVVNLDRNSPNVLFPHVPEMYDLQELDDRRCRDQLLCGMPIYYPCASMLKYVTNVVIPIFPLTHFTCSGLITGYLRRSRGSTKTRPYSCWPRRRSDCTPIDCSSGLRVRNLL